MDSTMLGKSTEQIRDSQDSLRSLPINQEIGVPAKGVVDPHSVQDTQSLRNAHNQGIIEDVRQQEQLRHEREQLSSEYLKEQLLSDREKLREIQSALQKDLTKVEKHQAKLEGKQAFVDKVKDGLASGLISAKDRIVGIPAEPVVGEPDGSAGMPGRYHPAPGPLEAGLMTRIGDKVQGGLASAQAGLISAKDRVIGPSVEPIEGGMPGRYHPEPEPLEAPAPGLMDRIKTGLTTAQTSAQAGLASVQSSAQAGLASAQAGLVTARDAVIGQKPIEPVGMPGRYHPRAAELEHKPAAPVWQAAGGSEVEKAPIDLGEAKGKLERELASVAGMPGPGRNHPNPETLETPSIGVATRIGDTVKGGLQYAKDTLASAKGAVSKTAPATAEYPLEARSEIEKEHIAPIEAAQTLEQLLPQQMEGMPGAGRYHPHPESLENLSLMDKMKIGLTSAKDTVSGLISRAQPVAAAGVQSAVPYAQSAKDTVSNLISGAQPTAAEIPLARSEIEKESIAPAAAMQTLEQLLPHQMEGMPGAGRYHPHPESLENLGLMDKMKIGLTSAKDTMAGGLSSAAATAQPYLASAAATAQPYLASAKERVMGPTVAPIETGMPGRNHPQPETFEAPAPGLATQVGDTMKQGLATAKETALPYVQSAKETAMPYIQSAKERITPAVTSTPAATATPTPTPILCSGPSSVGESELLAQDAALLNAQASLISAQAGLLSAQAGLLARRAEEAAPILPSQTLAPPPTLGSLETQTQPQGPGIMTRIGGGLASAKDTAQPYLSSAKDSAQAGLASAQPYLISAKDSAQAGLASVAQKAQPYLTSAKERVIETGTQAPAMISNLGETVKGGLVSAKDGLIAAKDQVVASRETTHPGMFLEPVSVVDHKSIDQPAAREQLEHSLPVEPARNHPDAASLKAQDAGLMTRIGSTMSAPLTYAKETLVSAKDKIVGMGSSTVHAEGTVPLSGPRSEIVTDSIDHQAVRQKMEETLAEGTVDPLGGVLAPGRNHPDADSLKAHDQGLLSSITGAIKNVFKGDKHESV